MFDDWVFVHIVGVLGFLGAHGVSATVGLRLRKERDPARVTTLLDLSARTRPVMYASLGLLLLGGVVAGFQGDLWGTGWIWVSLGLFVVLLAIGVVLAVPYYGRVRRAAAAAATGDSGSPPGGPDLGTLLASGRPIVIAVTQTIGLVVILYLMVFQPF